MKLFFKLIGFLLLIIIFINLYMIVVTNNKIVDIDNIDENQFDCILVLGAGIINKRPSPMLEDRLLTSIDLYDTGVSDKILVSGDHINNDYDEVSVMKNYLIENEIKSENVFMDHAGISSYDSIYRAKYIYKVNKVVIVTQKYHLYRALYIANSLGLDVSGVVADKNIYNGQMKRDIREFFARVKDFFKSIVRPSSYYLGEIHPINGNGDNTNNK